MKGPLLDAEKIKKLRQARSLTQEELAGLIKRSKRTIENVESGRTASAGTIRELAKQLGVEVGEITIPEPDFVGAHASSIYNMISATRRDALTGVWVGWGRDANKGKDKRAPRKFDVRWEIEVRGNFVYGVSTIEYEEIPDDRSKTFKLEGGFVYGRFCQLNYATKGTATRFGSVVVELDNHGERLEGSYVGFSHIQNGIVHGIVKLKKSADE